MSRLTNLALAVSAGSIGFMAVQAAPSSAASTSSAQAQLVGKLGYEGGAAPGGFHPTAGTVVVNFDGVTPLSLAKHVGPSGHFKIPLPAGQYTVTGCGPSASGSGSSGQCSKPQNITLTAGEIDHIRLVWALAP
jgi:hypothetical protein